METQEESRGEGGVIFVKRLLLLRGSPKTITRRIRENVVHGRGDVKSGLALPHCVCMSLCVCSRTCVCIISESVYALTASTVHPSRL